MIESCLGESVKQQNKVQTTDLYLAQEQILEPSQQTDYQVLTHHKGH